MPEVVTRLGRSICTVVTRINDVVYRIQQELNMKIKIVHPDHFMKDTPDVSDQGRNKFFSFTHADFKYQTNLTVLSVSEPLV